MSAPPQYEFKTAESGVYLNTRSNTQKKAKGLLVRIIKPNYTDPNDYLCPLCAKAGVHNYHPYSAWDAWSSNQATWRPSMLQEYETRMALKPN